MAFWGNEYEIVPTILEERKEERRRKKRRKKKKEKRRRKKKENERRRKKKEEEEEEKRWHFVGAPLYFAFKRFRLNAKYNGDCILLVRT